MKIKEILATTANKMAHNARDNQFEDYKQQLIERIIKTANDGQFSLHVNTYSCPGGWGGLKQWLESLGFVVGWNSRNLMATIRWDDLSIAEIDMMTEPKPATTKCYGTTPAGVSYAWEFDENSYDFVCAHCDGHSEYTTDYCPNCGAKMHLRIGDRRRNYGT